MPKHYRPITASLRSRLLAISVLVVLVMSAMVYFPALGSFRVNFLEERAKSALVAALATEEANDNRFSLMLEQEILSAAGVIAVVVGRSDYTLILGADIMPEEANAAFDLRGASLGGLAMDALDTLDHKGQRIIRFLTDGQNQDTRFVEVTMDEEILYAALRDYANRLLAVALIVSLTTGGLVYLALHILVVRPMSGIRSAIARFSDDPEKPVPALKRSQRADEIGIVQRELARMQEEVGIALRQKNRLAELGEAVAKINHDLRNILATAHLSSDHMSRYAEPRLQKTANRLRTSIERAVDLCERTMAHGKAAEPTPEPANVSLRAIAEDVAETLGLMGSDEFTVVLDIPDDFQIHVDEAQFHRVLLNLCQNAKQAQAQAQAQQDTPKTITIAAKRDDTGMAHIQVSDRGPGIPAALLPDLFKAFQAGQSSGTTGLGLAIAREIIVAHQGQIGLERTGPDGTCFLICLPGKETS